MAKLIIKKATTDVTVYLFIQASNVTTGAGLTGLTFETASLVASYVRPLGARAALTLATLAAVDSAHSDGGFKEIDATNMPGVYRLDLPDAVCATGVNSVVVMLKGAANMAPVLLEIQLLTNDPNDIATATALQSVDDLVDDLESRLTAARAGYLDKLNVSGTLAHSDAAATYKADVSALATQTSVNAIPTAPLLAANYTAPDNATITTIAGNVDDLETRLTAARAGYLDNLNTGVALTPAGVDAILDEVVIGTYTMRQLLKVLAAKTVGKATGGGTTSITYRGVDDTSNVIVETVDANGNRSAVTLTV